MRVRTEDAERFRGQAAELRLASKGFSDANRRTVLRIADDYDKMADTIESMDATMQKMDLLLKANHVKP